MAIPFNFEACSPNVSAEQRIANYIDDVLSLDYKNDWKKGHYIRS